MIDWLSLLFNFLWILALSGCLAVLSWAYAAVQREGIPFRQAIKSTPSQLGLYASAILFCAGLAGSTQPGLEKWVWTGLAILWGIQMGATLLENRKNVHHTNQA